MSEKHFFDKRVQLAEQLRGRSEIKAAEELLETGIRANRAEPQAGVGLVRLTYRQRFGF